MAAAKAANVEHTHLAEEQPAIFQREGVWYARVYVEKEYIFRSLKTCDKTTAIKEAYKLLGSIENNIANNRRGTHQRFKYRGQLVLGLDRN